MRAKTSALTGALALAWAGTALAAPPRTPEDFDFEETFALGIVEHHLDDQTEVIGWHLKGSWYLGREDGKQEDALSLIWQGRRKQFSISTEGIRFTRRF